MKTIIALCSTILLVSFTGVRAQTDSTAFSGDSLQSPVTSSPGVTEAPAPTPAPVRSIPASRNNSLKGVRLMSCNGLYLYSKTVQTEYDYDWYTGDVIPYEVTYKSTTYALLVNANIISGNGLSLGASFGFLNTYSKRTSDYDDHLFDYNYGASSSMSLIGPRVAYYHGKKDSKAMPFAAFEFDILNSDFYDDNALRIGAGVLMQPVPHLGISFELDYLKFGKEENSTNIIGVLGLTGIFY